MIPHPKQGTAPKNTLQGGTRGSYRSPRCPHPAALTDVLQQEGQSPRGSSQGVPGCHIELVGGEGKHLQVPEGAAPRARGRALTCGCAVPGDTGTAAQGLGDTGRGASGTLTDL